MCARYVTKATAEWERWFSIRRVPQFASYNVAPTDHVPVIAVGEEGNGCELMRFGMIPFFARGIPPRFSTINARMESLATNASWRGPWQRGQRCLVPANGFYEWQLQPDGRTKQPYYIHAVDREAFGFAALWDRSIAADGSAVFSFSIITVPASPLLAQIHNTDPRQPAMLAVKEQEIWLRDTPDRARIALKPYPDDLLVAWPVSTRVNAAKNNDSSLVEPITVPARPT